MDNVERVFGLKTPLLATSKLTSMVCSNPDLLCGVELEVENVGDLGRIQDKLNLDAWNVVEDGSLRPPGVSWEFVSKPMRMDQLLAEMTQLFKTFKFTNDKNYSDRTSVHLHTNVLDFTQEQLATLALVYTVTEDILFEFINKHKAPTEDGYSRDTNIYCIPWTQSRMGLEFVGKLFSSPKVAVKNWQKYSALNLRPVLDKGTVEWRHMHGTCDMEKLTLWFNLIGSIMRFAKTVEFNDVMKTVLMLNDTSAYQQFFHSVLQNYVPYDEAYAKRMADGVITAKYTLINKDRKKSIYDELVEARDREENQDHDDDEEGAGDPDRFAEPPAERRVLQPRVAGVAADQGERFTWWDDFPIGGNPAAEVQINLATMRIPNPPPVAPELAAAREATNGHLRANLDAAARREPPRPVQARPVVRPGRGRF